MVTQEDVILEQEAIAPTYISGYQFLLDEQPQLLSTVQNSPKTALLGGCATTLFPMFIDYKFGIESNPTLWFFVAVAFTAGYYTTKTAAQIAEERNAKQIESANLDMMRYWKRPIFILPYDRNDSTVEKRCIKVAELLNDEKCANPLHTTLVDVEKRFAYKVEFGFRKGIESQTEIGLPVVSLYPSLFLLRGANDEKSWLAFQNEAVRIAEEIDEAFAKYWHAEDAFTFKQVAGGLLMI